ncbi:MAG: hypothetical protein ACE5HN_08885, partial [Nitrospiria bacterium]
MNKGELKTQSSPPSSHHDETPGYADAKRTPFEGATRITREHLKAYLARRKEEIDRLLQSYLPRPPCEPALIHEAVRYSL